jgi:hypothetical protein
MGPVIPPGDGELGRVAWILVIPVAIAVVLYLFA